jgi:erythromycin esterase-like protein
MRSRSIRLVWAHNSHLGDARATHMALQGELNVGQLARERFGRDVVSIGFTTHTGSATAANNWDELAELMAVGRHCRTATSGTVITSPPASRTSSISSFHYDETRAVEPLELWSRRTPDLAETWPTGV